MDTRRPRPPLPPSLACAGLRLLLAACLATAAACTVDSGAQGGAYDDAVGAASAAAPDRRPRRVVSLDFCADQFALKFLDREQIVAVSPHARDDYSYMRDAADGIPTVRDALEDVLARRPDVVVRSYGGGPNATALLERAGVRVVQLGWAGDIDAVKAGVLAAATELGAAERGARVVARMERRLAAVRPDSGAHSDDLDAAAPTALYVTPAGVTAGPGTLIDHLFRAAGLRNFQRAPGWQPIPLERLAYEQPDLAVPGFFGSTQSPLNAWTSIDHPVVQRQLATLPTVPIEGAWTSCGGWFLVDAVEALAAATPEHAAARGAAR